MVFPPLPAVRALTIAGFVLLTLAACGRRGGLEAPGAQAVGGAATTAEPEEERRQAGSSLATPVPADRARSARRSITVPNQPFILDPLL